MILPSRSTIAHLRFPFSIFLLPIFLAAMAVAGTVDSGKAWLVFAILHLLVYPASNGFNSWFDKDSGPIGALAVPPAVTKDLPRVALFMDGLALAVSFFVSIPFALAVFGYGLGSKLYSWPAVRLKKYPIGGWLATGLGQGAATTAAIIIGISPNGFRGLGPSAMAAALLFTLLLLGIFPLTQIYQHDEDRRRGDITISVLLGVRGTFIFSGIFLALAIGGWCWYFLTSIAAGWALAFLLFQVPALVFFLCWAVASFRDASKADFRNAMIMNTLSSLLLNAFFAFYLLFR